MVYRGRRSYRRYRKRKTLGSYAIATRTSARSQARQIYALNRKVNLIQRRTKPEIMTWTQALAGSPVWSNTGALSWVAPVGPEQNTENEVQGHFARLLGFNLYAAINYTTLTETSQPVIFRCVVVQTVATRQSAPTIGDIIEGVSTQTSISSRLARDGIFGPLAQGLARSFKVLNDRKYYLSYQRPFVSIKISRKRLLSWWSDPNNNEPVNKGEIYVIIVGYVSGTNESTSMTTQPFTITAQTKLAYTDA